MKYFSILAVIMAVILISKSDTITNGSRLTSVTNKLETNRSLYMESSKLMGTGMFAMMWNITRKTNAYELDYTATNIVMAIYVTNQIIVVRTNDAWQITFKP